MLGLEPEEAAFVAALRRGETAKEYAAGLNYSWSWAKWMSGRVRQKLGVDTMREAVRVSEYADEIKRLGDRLEDLAGAVARATTPQQREQARSGLDDELKLRGLTLNDLDALRESKENDRIAAAVDAALQRRDEEKAKADAEAAAADAAEEEGNEGGEGGSLGDRVRDGLGGILR